uniref:Uncharacterized protein n=1 Tax=Heterorhabditis bacteriophora TaxID=37862 RepID=A0A1I7WX42_HETBA
MKGIASRGVTKSTVPVSSEQITIQKYKSYHVLQSEISPQSHMTWA